MEIGTVKQIDIRDEMQGAYLDYAMSVITARALPDVRDGLKPVQRRILYAMGEMGLRHNSAYKKSARIVGDVLGRYHPHSDQAVYDALVRMAQDFTMRYPLVDGQGNFGSIDDDPPAAMRYTEARLTELAEEMLLDIEKNTVDLGPNFDGSLKEPLVLPAKVPNLLLNGSAGIAVGMATQIPPHNLSEVADAVRYVIENWNRLDDIEPDDLMQFVRGPDFPTGGIILGTDGIKEAYATGKGRLVVRGKIHTEMAAGGKARIVITELPYQVNKAALVERIAELVRDRRIEEIGDLRDESDRQGMSIIVELKRGVEPTPVINTLLKLTALQASYTITMLALVEGEPRILSLKKVLQSYVEHRREVVTRRTQFELDRTKARAHILEGLKIALDYLDEVIKTIRQSPDADVAKERLMKRFKLSDLQAQAILDMQLRRLAALERKKIEEELADLRKRIKSLEELLRSPKKILGVIQEELADLKERFGDARRTFISAGEATEFTAASNVPEQDVIVELSRSGSIRWMPTSDYRRTRSDAVKGVQTREEDPVQEMLLANTHATLVLFSNQGRAFPLRMQQVPDVSRNPAGLVLRGVLGLENSERVVAAVPVAEFREGLFITLATTGGKIKRTPVAEFEGLPSAGARAANLAEGDELGWALLTQGKDEFLTVTANGQALRFLEDDVPVQGRVAAGVWAIKLGEGDRVIGLDALSRGTQALITSELGFVKRTPVKDFPVKGRYTGGVVAYSYEARTGHVTSARLVDEEEDVTFVTRNGTELRLRVANVQKANRGARGRLVVALKGEDVVSQVVRLEPDPAQEQKPPTLQAEPPVKPKGKSGPSDKAPRVTEEKVNGDSHKTPKKEPEPEEDGHAMQMEFASFKPLPKKK